jgi:hypothetical protein
LRTKIRRRRTGAVRVAATGAGVALGLVALALFLLDDPATGNGDSASSGPATGEGVAEANGVTAANDVAAANGGAAPEAGSDVAPVVPIAERFDVTGAWTFHDDLRRDYSGVLYVALADSGRAPRLWLVDDKPDEAESLVVEVRWTAADAEAATTSGRTGRLHPGPVRVDNRFGRPLGDDVEDLDALPADGDRPMLLALVGERGPRLQPASWLALALVDTAGEGRISIIETRDASPPGETVGNDGLEGVALLALGGDTVAVMTFKERTPPIYVRSYLYRWRNDDSASAVTRPLDPIGEPLLDHVPGVATQASATFGPDGDLYVLDRYARRIAVVPRARVVAALRDPADDAMAPREWLDFTSLVPALEGRSGAPDVDAPLSIFGTAEGLAFGADGTLYLLSDNNESGPSVLLTLTPRR